MLQKQPRRRRPQHATRGVSQTSPAMTILGKQEISLARLASVNSENMGSKMAIVINAKSGKVVQMKRLQDVSLSGDVCEFTFSNELEDCVPEDFRKTTSFMTMRVAADSICSLNHLFWFINSGRVHVLLSTFPTSVVLMKPEHVQAWAKDAYALWRWENHRA